MLVPPELIDHIFSSLRGEGSALEACSKAHPTFSMLAEPYLYEEVLVTTNEISAVDELYVQFSANPHMLDFPRTLHFDRTFVFFPNYALLASITRVMLLIPRMVNLTSLSFQGQPWIENLFEDFVSAFGTCLQGSAIEELSLEEFQNFPLALLDNCKNIKKLMLSDCTISEDGPLQNSGSLHKSLETLMLEYWYNADLLVWAMHRATSLTTLEFRDSRGELHWANIRGLLTACSNSLTSLHFDCANHVQSVYVTDGQLLSTSSSGVPVNGRWVGDGLLPITLSENTHLIGLSVSAELNSNSNARIQCALPAIIRFIKTASSIIPDVDILFHRSPISHRAPIDPLELSPLLDRIRSDFPANSEIRPRIGLHVNDLWGHPKYHVIRDVLETAANEDLTDL